MKVKLKKHAGGEAVVTFVRTDGSAASGRIGSGGFGAVHDLTHYAVETTLGLRQGFYGLLAQGWDIQDFEVKGAAHQLPDEAIVTECIVGQLGNAVFAGREPAVEEFNWLVRSAVDGVRPGAAVPVIDAESLRLIWHTLEALLARWRALPPGETLGLDYPAA
ncbi:MAG: hypothetical protein HYX71_04550 [Opitutae bacterium]|nr:hypothetical protein [Opitutae bacterium]